MHGGTYITCLVEDVACGRVERYTPTRTVCPALTIVLESTILGDTGVDPRSHAESDTLLGIVGDDLGLSDMRSSKVNAEVAQGALGGSNHAHGEHATMEDEVGTATIEGESCEAFDSNTHSTILMLVVIGDVVLAVSCTCRVEVVLSWSEAYGHRLACCLSLHLGKHLLHETGYVGSCIRHYAIRSGIIYFLGMQTYNRQEADTKREKTLNHIYPC